MPDSTINGLAALSGANVDNSADQFPIWDNSASTTKKISRAELMNGLPVTYWGTLGSSNSQDAVAIISRSVDSSGAGNGHAFSDSSDVTRSGTIAYNSFDARCTFSGTSNFDHYAAFQSGPVFETTGTITNYYSFVDAAAIGKGTITNFYSFMVLKPVVYGTGSITNQFGIFFPSDFAVGASNSYAYANQSATAKFWHNNTIAGKGLIGTQTERAIDSGIQVQAFTEGGTATKFRLRQSGYNFWDAEIPAGSTRLVFSDYSGEKFSMDQWGNVVCNYGAVSASATDGFLYVASCAGTPTGVPRNYSGRAALVIDSSNEKLWAYVNGSWKSCSLT